MFLVKSCSKKYNICNSKNLKIGTLHEYRETENEQISDKEEGFFNIKFDIKDKFIEIKLFNYLNYSHNSHLSAHINYLHIKSKFENYMKVDYKAEYHWINNNRFIFCISKLECHENSISIFPDYDDYWYISFFKKESFIKCIEKALFDEVVKQIKNGNQIFQEDITNINKLTISSHHQDIMYISRSLYLDNHNITSMKDQLIGIFNDIKYIKPVTFKKEHEFRIVFDFYNDGILLTPRVKNILIPDSVSHLINQPNLCQ